MAMFKHILIPTDGSERSARAISLGIARMRQQRGLGGQALAATASLSANDQACVPRSLVLMAATVDPAANPTRVSRLIRSRPLSWYEHNVITRVPPPDGGQGRLVYPGSVQLMGLWAYLARHLREGGELLGKLVADDGGDPVRFPFLDLYSAVMDLSAEVFLDIMRHVYLERTLVRGHLSARNEKVALNRRALTFLPAHAAERVPHQEQPARLLPSTGVAAFSSASSVVTAAVGHRQRDADTEVGSQPHGAWD
jgi:hypothetical protein